MARAFKRIAGRTNEPEYLGVLTAEDIPHLHVLATLCADSMGRLCFTVKPGPLDKLDSEDAEIIVEMVRKCLLSRVRPQG